MGVTQPHSLLLSCPLQLGHSVSELLSHPTLQFKTSDVSHSQRSREIDWLCQEETQSYVCVLYLASNNSVDGSTQEKKKHMEKFTLLPRIPETQEFQTDRKNVAMAINPCSPRKRRELACQSPSPLGRVAHVFCFYF